MDVKDLTLFRNLTGEELEKSLVCSQSRIEEYGRNAYIFRQEDVPKNLYFVLEGTVELGRLGGLGRLNHVEYVNAGQGFGEVELFLEHHTYDCFAKADSPVKLLAVSRHFFYSSCPRNCAHHSKIVYNMLQIFAEEAEKHSRKIYLLTCGTLRQRIAGYLLQAGGGKDKVELTMKREELAAYLNTVRPSLSRELSCMQEEGIIEISGRRQIRILDRGRLVELEQ